MPRRVLNIDNTQKLSDDSIIALYGATDNLRADYVALSHCWGKHQPLRTLVSNYQSLIQSGIRLSQLSAVFRDAIHVCHRLNVNYLWIDSLASSRTAKRTGNENQHVCATTTKTPSSPFRLPHPPMGSVPFLRQRPERWRRQTFPFHDGNQMKTVMTHRRPRGPNRGSSTVQTQVEDDEALLTRAWVFQEGQLSRRVIEYTASTLVRACHTERIVEGGAQRGAFSPLQSRALPFEHRQGFGDLAGSRCAILGPPTDPFHRLSPRIEWLGTEVSQPDRLAVHGWPLGRAPGCRSLLGSRAICGEDRGHHRHRYQQRQLHCTHLVLGLGRSANLLLRWLEWQFAI